MNKKAQTNFEGILGSIFALIFLIISLSAVVPLLFSLGDSDGKQGEIDELNNKINELTSIAAAKDIKISQLEGVINARDNTLDEKDRTISDLTGQLKNKDQIIENLTKEISFYTEKTYLQEITNNYHNISNYFEKVENKFFPITVSISLISLTLFALILKDFSVISFIKRKLWKSDNDNIKNSKLDNIKKENEKAN